MVNPIGFKASFSPAFEILTFSSVTFPPDYLVTDASDFAAILLGPESEIEYFEASSVNRDSDHLRRKMTNFSSERSRVYGLWHHRDVSSSAVS